MQRALVGTEARALLGLLQPDVRGAAMNGDAKEGAPVAVVYAIPGAHQRREPPRRKAWMPLWPKDVLAELASMTEPAQTAYIKLLCNYWEQPGPLLADDNRLAAMAGVTPSVWKRIRAELAPRHFSIDGGFWRHAHLDGELDRWRSKRAALSANARKRWGSR